MASPRKAPVPQGQSGALYVRTGQPQMEVIPTMDELEASAVIATPAVDGPQPEGQPEPAPEPAPAPTPTEPSPAPVAPASPEPVDPLAAKWEQMTPEQRADSWRNSQQLIGRQGEEVGILRKAVDRFAAEPPRPAAPVTPPAPVPAPINFEDDSALVTELLTNPRKVITALEERAEARVMGKLKSSSIEAQMNERRARDLPLIHQSEEAKVWLSRVPQQLVAQADADPQMWDFLMSQAPIHRTASPSPAAPQPAAPRAPVVLGNAGAPSAAAKPAQTGKMWTRKEIAELYTYRNDEYALRADEIAKAYAENRVRD